MTPPTSSCCAVCELGVMLVRNSERSKLLFERLDSMAGESWVGPPACPSWPHQQHCQAWSWKNVGICWSEPRHTLWHAHSPQRWRGSCARARASCG